MQKEDEEQSKHIPEDVIQPILTRLPIKSIIRFKSVCKVWYSIVKSRFFIELHREFQLLCNTSRFSPPSFYKSQFIAEYDLNGIGRSLPQKKGPGPGLRKILQVLGPLNNGIGCIVVREFATAFKPSFLTHRCWKFSLCNLATKERNYLSPFPFSSVHHCSRIDSVYYGFGSIQKTSKFGLKSHQIAVDYKLILIILLESHAVLAYTYSLVRGSWKQIFDSTLRGEYPEAVAGLINEHDRLRFPKIAQHLGLSQAYVNGYCHWRAQPLDLGAEYRILRFDMATEVFDLRAGPPENYDNLGSSWGLFVLNDRLAATISVIKPVPNFQREINVWLMMEYGLEKSWTKIHSCELPMELGFRVTFLGMSFSRSTKDCHGFSAIERMYFEIQTQGRDLMLISCGRSGFEEHSDFDRTKLCFSGYVQALEPPDVELDSRTKMMKKTTPDNIFMHG